VSPFARVVLIAAATVLLYDAVAATASRVSGFPYGSAAVGSWLIYAGAGFFATRATGSLWMGVLAAAAAGLVDSTAGWLISAWIGPGRPESSASPGVIAGVVVAVPLMAGAIGLAGAVAARLLGARPG
jgi:hypothetical protein